MEVVGKCIAKAALIPGERERERACSPCIVRCLSPRTRLDGTEKLFQTWVRVPDRPARRQSLYRLCYPACISGENSTPVFSVGLYFIWQQQVSPKSVHLIMDHTVSHPGRTELRSYLYKNLNSPLTLWSWSWTFTV